MEKVLVLSVLFTVFGMFMWHAITQGERQNKGIFAECDAADAFCLWRRRNPDVFLGLSDEGRVLLGEWIVAVEELQRAFPYIESCAEKKEWLLSLLDEFPPNHPRRRGRGQPKERPLDVLFCVDILTPMTECAYGIIPFFENGHNLEVFLIHQYGSAGDTLWTFPKGRPEPGEVPLETALRECKEETGMIPDRVIEDVPISTSYVFDRRGARVEKTSTYFVALMREKAFLVQLEEVREAGWFTIGTARERITFPDYKKLLDEAISILDNYL
jgi:8-oxo-dGTP pyrophosphatase MutT (NUDIX family)